MQISRRRLPALAGVVFSLLLCGLIGAASADAAGPATVTVRAIGSNNQVLLPLTQVTTTTAPVVKDGKPEDSCTGTSAAGALQLATEATKGNWNGPWFSGLGYSVETVNSQSFPFTQPYYLTFWLDNKPATAGICGTELSPGDSVLFFPECFSETSGVCPPAPDPLGIEVPATVEVGRSVVVTVLSYSNPAGEPTPLAGATVRGGGDTTAPPTNAQGQTTLTFLSGGRFTINATGAAEGSPSIPAEAFVCAHEGNDGTCGTQAPSSPSGVKPPVSSGTPTNSAPIVAKAKISDVKNGHVYSRRAAPRLLKGRVVLPAGTLLRKVQISLKRQYRGHCYGFSGSRARFVAIKCKKAASWFSAGTKDSFSYLLPSRLAAGHYTYEVEAVDGTGRATKLVSGVSKVAFQVK